MNAAILVAAIAAIAWFAIHWLTRKIVASWLRAAKRVEVKHGQAGHGKARIFK